MCSCPSGQRWLVHRELWGFDWQTRRRNGKKKDKVLLLLIRWCFYTKAVWIGFFSIGNVRLVQKSTPCTRSTDDLALTKCMRNGTTIIVSGEHEDKLGMDRFPAIDHLSQVLGFSLANASCALRTFLSLMMVGLHCAWHSLLLAWSSTTLASIHSHRSSEVQKSHVKSHLT